MYGQRGAIRADPGGTGDVVVIEPGVHHNFRNSGTEIARFNVEVRPAIQIESLIETMYGLAADGIRWATDNGARIINLTSIVGEVGSAGQGPYVAAKAGVAEPARHREANPRGRAPLSSVRVECC